jgi:hypothetical protein
MAYNFVRMNDRTIPAAQADHETDQSRPERARDPGDEYEEQRQAGFLERCETVRPQDVPHEPGQEQRRQERQAKEQRATPCRYAP